MNNHSTRPFIAFAALVAMALTASVATAAGPAATVGPAALDGEQAYRFQLRALGGNVGEAVFSIGDLMTVGDRELRPVRMDARTGGLAEKLYKANTTSTTWMDPAWLPVRARWDSHTPKGKRMVKARFAADKLDSEYFRDGKLKKKIDARLRRPITDIIGVFAWVMAQNLDAGNELATQVFDGARLYDVKATVGDIEELSIPMGLRDAIPVRVTVTRGAKFKKKMVLWFDARDRTPYKMSFSYGVFGAIDAVLVGQKRV